LQALNSCGSAARSNSLSRITFVNCKGRFTNLQSWPLPPLCKPVQVACSPLARTSPANTRPTLHRVFSPRIPVDSTFAIPLDNCNHALPE
jgi:hypothetical protein